MPRLTSEEWKQILIRLRSNASDLESLELEESEIGSSEAKELSDALRENHNLKSLSLWQNSLENGGVLALSAGLKQNNTLESLDLGSNQIEDSGIKQLSDDLKKNQSLTSLDLNYNQIGNEGAKYLSELLSKNRTLISLDLQYNQIGNSGAEHLKNALKNNDSIELLELTGNQIGDKLKTEIDEYIQRNKKLRKSKKKLSEEDLIELVAEEASKKSVTVKPRSITKAKPPIKLIDKAKRGSQFFSDLIGSKKFFGSFKSSTSATNEVTSKNLKQSSFSADEFQHSLEPTYEEDEKGNIIIGKTYMLINKINKEQAQILSKQAAIDVVFEPGENEAKFELGKGEFSTVGLAFDRKTQQFVAVKKIEGEQKIELSKKEAELQSSLYSNTLLVLDSVEIVNRDQRVLYQFLPLASFGNGKLLQLALAQSDDVELKRKVLIHTAHGLLKGLAAMHQQRVYHLDMRLHNFVINREGKIFIIDFGCARKLTAEEKLISGGNGHTDYYSPERLADARYCCETQQLKDQLLLADEKSKGFLPEKADAWALGLILFELAANCYPFDYANIDTKLATWNSTYFATKLAARAEMKDSTLEDYMAIVKGLLQVEPAKRLTIEQALTRLTPILQQTAFDNSSDERINTFTNLKKSVVATKMESTSFIEEKSREENKAYLLTYLATAYPSAKSNQENNLNKNNFFTQPGKVKNTPEPYLLYPLDSKRDKQEGNIATRSPGYN